MHDEPLRQTPTHAIDEAEGRVFGLNLSGIKWVVIALLLGLVPGFLFLPFFGLAVAATIMFGPALVVAAFQYFLLQNRPPRWFSQWVETRLVGGHFSSLGGLTVRAPVEAYCAGGVVCSPDPGGKLHLSRGVRVHVPENRAASNSVRNQLCACLSQATGMLPEGGRAQIIWSVINDPGDQVKAYAGDTPADAPEAVQRYRNQKAIHFLKSAQAGQIRREEVTLWMGQEVERPQPTKEERKDLDSFYNRILRDMAAETGKLLNGMEAALAPAGVNFERLDANAVAQEWHRTFNPSTASRCRAIFVPADAAFPLTEVCCPGELRGMGNRGFMLDGEHFKVFTLRRLYDVAYPGIVDHLTTLPIPDFNITVLLHRLPRKELMDELQARLKKVQEQLQRRHDPQLDVTRAQLEEKISQLARGAITPLEMKFIVVLHAATPDELQRQEDLLKGAAARINLQLFEANLAATARDLFLLTLPGRLHGNEACFAHYGESEYLAPLLPLPNSFHGFIKKAQALFLGVYLNLIGVRLFVGEGKASTPQHCLICGMNGSGKSYFVAYLQIETHCWFHRSYLIDYGGSHRRYSEAVGAKMHVITPDCPWTFNLFGDPGLPDSSSRRALTTALAGRMVGAIGNDDESQDKRALLAKHVAAVCAAFADAWLRRQTEAERLRLARHALVLHRLVGERMWEPVEAFISLRDEVDAGSPDAQKLLAAPTDAEVRTFATKHRDLLRELAFAYLPEYPTLSSLRQQLEIAGAKDEKCARLADRLRPWCRGGSYGKLFDGQSNVNFNDPVIHFELGRLDSSAKDLQAVLWFLLLIVVQQQCLRRPAAETKRIVLEEISQALTIPGFEEIFRTMLATFRKLNVQCNFVCQQVAQLESDTLRRVILGNVRMAFIFQPGTPTDLDLISEHLPLSDAAKKMIMRYVMPDQLRGTIYSECCYLHVTEREPLCGTIRFVPIGEN